jgi:hypothetical protein
MKTLFKATIYVVTGIGVLTCAVLALPGVVLFLVSALVIELAILAVRGLFKLGEAVIDTIWR